MKKSLLLLLAAVFATSAVFGQNTELPLKAGDRVTVRIAGVPDNEIAQISGVYTISDAGTIKLPHLSSGVRAAGMKPSKLQSLIEQTYVGEQIYTRPNITISTDDGGATARTITIVSGCQRNGAVPYSANLTIFKAIGTAGGFSPFAKPSKAKLIRNGQVTPLDLSRYDPSVDIKLEPEDQIIVPE
jgi:protein involved in polysaccharide export with SLBB domain